MYPDIIEVPKIKFSTLLKTNLPTKSDIDILKFEESILERISIISHDAILVCENSKVNYAKRINNAFEVFIPSYGNETYIRACCLSLKMQPEPSSSFHIIDDKSHDNSNDIALDFLKIDSRFFLHIKTYNSGLLDTRMLGFHLLSGNYILNLDADDILSLTALDRIKQLIYKDKEPDIIAFGMLKWFPDRSEIHHTSFMDSSQTVFRDFLNQKINFSVCNKAYKKELVKLALSDPKYKRLRQFHLEDLYHNLTLLFHARRLSAIQSPLYIYRITPNSDSRKPDQKSIENRALSSLHHLRLARSRVEQTGDEKNFSVYAEFEKKIHEDYIKKAKFNSIERKNNQYKVRKIGRPLSLPLPYHLLNTISFKYMISIIVPVYNTGKYLGNCIQSITSQNINNIEILVINDCSTDLLTLKTLNIIQEHRQIKIINHKENKGLMQARMTGIKEAKGKYITHVDSDDQLNPGIYRKALTRIENEKADILQFGYAEKRDGILNKKLCDTNYQINNARDIWIKFLRLEKTSNSMWNKIFRSDILKTTITYLPSTNRKAEDLIQNILNFSMCNKFIHMSDLGYIYLIRDGSGDRTMEASHVIGRVHSFVHIFHLMHGCKHKFRPGDDIEQAISYRCELITNRLEEQIKNTLRTCTNKQSDVITKALSNIPNHLSRKIIN